MKRRTCLQAMAALGAGGVVPAATATKPIQLHVDLKAKDGRAEEMIRTFHAIFEPVIRQQPGFVAVILLQLDPARPGKNPDHMTHRLVISFETEEQRKAWIATDDHQRVWGEVEKNVASYEVQLYDVV